MLADDHERDVGEVGGGGVADGLDVTPSPTIS
jgi:hypothetical protein